MKITSVEVFLLKPAIADSPYPSRPVVCRVNTDEGISGWGEAGIFTGWGEHGVFGMLQDLSPFYIGKDPFDADVIWEQIRTLMYGHMSGGGVIVWSALSALDTALMDIKGKALGLPCYKLLGGQFNKELCCYASHIQNGWCEDIGPRGTADEYAAIALRLKNLGYTAVKFDLLAFDRDKKPMTRRQTAHDLSKRQVMELVEERLAAVRNACGSDLEIMTDNLCRQDICAAWEMDEIAKKYGVLFMEECLDPFRADNYLPITAKCRTPLAGGEKVQTRWKFAEYFEKQIFRVIQPDISNCGGLTEAKKIADMANAYDIKVQAHIAGTGIAIAAGLQLEASIPNFSIHECLSTNDNPEMQAYCKYVVPVVNGYITVPDRPGIGNELSEQAVAEAVARLEIC